MDCPAVVLQSASHCDSGIATTTVSSESQTVISWAGGCFIICPLRVPVIIDVNAVDPAECPYSTRYLIYPTTPPVGSPAIEQPYVCSRLGWQHPEECSYGQGLNHVECPEAKFPPPPALRCQGGVLARSADQRASIEAQTVRRR